MRILITGGTGVIGRETVNVLLRHGHHVRVLARRAKDVARGGPLEFRAASITDRGELRGSADSCDVVLHIAGIVEEAPPEATFDAVNVAGTRNLVEEAARAGVRRFVYVSSLGADRGSSEYHRSKRSGEVIARGFPREWVIVRPGNVYGSGDEVLSKLLEWVRASPAVPVIGGGDDPFQPLWVGDAAAALAAAVARADLNGRVLEVAGPDRTTFNDLLDRMVALTGRSPVRIPIPAAAITAGVQTASALGVQLPINVDQLRMLREGNVIPDDVENALTGILGLVATPLDAGLRKLADSAPEQLPSDGFGPMQVRVFSAEAHGSRLTPAELIAKLRVNFARLMPNLVGAGAESGTPSRLYEGATLTLSLPVRGHIQVRVANVSETDVTLLTLRGHPLAGAVRFRTSERDDALRFEVQVYDRAASMADFALMALGGNALQGRTWQELVRNVMREAGVAEVEVQTTSVTLEDDQVVRVQKWLEELASRKPVSPSRRTEAQAP